MNVSRLASQLPRSRKYKKVANKATSVQTKKESAKRASAERLNDKTMTSIVSRSLLESAKSELGSHKLNRPTSKRSKYSKKSECT